MKNNCQFVQKEIKMKKSLFIILGLVSVVIVGFTLIQVLQPEPIWEVNAKRLSNSFDIISGNNATIDDLSSFTRFEWDTLYNFAPYTPEERIYEVVGYRWDKIYSTVSEGMNQIVFLNNGKVICYVDGYPDKYKIFFSFGQYSGDYYKLTISDKLTFNMTITDDEIRMLTYDK